MKTHNIFKGKSPKYISPFYIFLILFSLGSLTIGVTSCDEDIPDVGEIPDLTPPNSDFSYEINDNPYNEVSFTNLSTSSTDYLWDFGDGNTSDGKDPTHTYTVDGTYTVTLTSSDKNNVVSTSSETFLIQAALATDFSYEVDMTDPKMVTFTNLTVSGNTYAWDFGDGNTSDDENPVHTYADFGIYTVTLMATSTIGEEETVTQTLPLPDPNATVEANFTSTPGNPNTLEITFTNLSAGADTYTWDFGDGVGTSTDDNPVYTYAAPGGTFTVTLVAVDQFGNDNTFAMDITVTNPAPTFTPVILEPGFEDNSLPDGSGDGRDSWRDSGEELGGVIQITSGPTYTGSQAAKLPSDGSRVGYQAITVEAYQDYTLTFHYTMKETPVGSLTVSILDQEVNSFADLAAATLATTTVNDQVDDQQYITENLPFNSGPNTEVIIYFKNVDVECRLDDFSISY